MSAVALLLASVSLFTTAYLFSAVQASRMNALDVSCGSANQTTDKIVDAIKNFLVASSAAAGDTPLPVGEKDPYRWTGIRRGPLSRSIMRAIPNYPSGSEALMQARVRADRFDKSIPRRNCAAEVAAITER